MHGAVGAPCAAGGLSLLFLADQTADDKDYNGNKDQGDENGADPMQHGISLLFGKCRKMGWNRSDGGVELGGLLIGAHQHIDHQGQGRQGEDQADDIDAAGE